MENENQTTHDAFITVAPLYDELMTGVPYDEWVAYLHKLLDLRQVTPRRILDLAAEPATFRNCWQRRAMK